MNSQLKIQRIQSMLNKLYPDPPVPLNYRCPFTFMCAVVLSAQTTDGKVNQVTKELFQCASTPYAMSRLPYEEVLRIIQPVGLAPKKAEYLIGLSKMLVEEFDSCVPNTYESLERLPGVGHKTASVVLSHVFGMPALAVDTHVHRLALRWGLSKETNNVNKVQADLCAVFPESSWSKIHLQMIYFGREHCVAKGHENSRCPICSWVHKKDVPAVDFEDNFELKSPHKKVKGIVYYQDRIDELVSSPMPSFEAALAAEASIEVKREQEPEVQADLHGRKRRKVSDVSGDSVVPDSKVETKKKAPSRQSRRSKP